MSLEAFYKAPSRKEHHSSQSPSAETKMTLISNVRSDSDSKNSDRLKNTEIRLEASPQPGIKDSQRSCGDVPASATRSVNTSLGRSSCHSMQSVSTATYERQEQEAQDAFNQRIEKLCQDLWPAPTSIKHRFLTSQAVTRLRTSGFFRSFIPAPEVPLIHHLDGGGFNHITSITLPSSFGAGNRHLIVRIPREDQSRPDQQVATLDYVRRRTSIPVAMIEATDFSCNNAVGRPYVLQHRIPGSDLDTLWDELSHPQRCVVAREIGDLIRILLSVESPIAGTIEAAGSGSDTSAELPVVVPFELKDRLGDPIEELKSDGATKAGNSRPLESTLELLENCFLRWREAALAESLEEMNFEAGVYDDLLTVVREMDNVGLFQPDMNCLCHLDLHPRNIMVEFCAENSVRVTGILDWDEAVVAPKFVNCEPPGWLWGYDKETHTENSLLPWPYELEGANSTPSTPEQQELKQIFDESAGLEYPRLAYDDSSRLIRGLFRIATLGLPGSWFYTAAERIVKEWQVLRPTFTKDGIDHGGMNGRRL